MKILVKYPTRQRPELFLSTLRRYAEKAKDNSSITYLISYDGDDVTMTPAILAAAKETCPEIILRSGLSNSKIHACNRDVNETPVEWHTILLVSDDMECQLFGWDQRIREEMKRHYPDTDGCLWFHDGSDQKRISTLSCIGRKYYDRFGYLYYPEYKSFFCDNEYTEIAVKENKIQFLDEVIIKHRHPAWDSSAKNDPLYIRNNKYWNHDQELYRKRKSLNFPI